MIMKMLQKLVSLLLIAALSLASASALAGVLAPDDTDYEDLAGVTVNATVGAFNEADQTFEVTLYADDLFEIDDVEKLAAGDILLAGGQRFVITEKSVNEFDEVVAKCDAGWDIIFSPVGDDKMIAMIAEDDRRFMHVFAVLHLPAAAGITLEDASDPEGDPIVTTGLEEILKIKQEKETNSNGLDFYATVITLNNQLEIERIHQDFDVAQ